MVKYTPVNRNLSRREMIGLVGTTAAAVLVGCERGQVRLIVVDEPVVSETDRDGDASLHREAGTDGRPLFRGRQTQPVRHPIGSLGRLGERRCSTPARASCPSDQRQRLHAARGRHGGCLALRRARRLFGRSGSVL